MSAVLWVDPYYGCRRTIRVLIWLAIVSEKSFYAPFYDYTLFLSTCVHEESFGRIFPKSDKRADGSVPTTLLISPYQDNSNNTEKLYITTATLLLSLKQRNRSYPS